MKLSFKFNFLLLALLFSFNLYAFGFSFGGDSGSNDGSSNEPYELVVNGDKRSNDDPTKYYSLYSSVNQDITVHITNHSSSNSSKNLTLTLYDRLNSGECGNTSFGSSSPTNGVFDWTFSANGGRNYCLKVDGESSSWTSNRKYDIKLTAAATPLKVGVSDASAIETDSSIDFIFVLTKATTSDVDISYVFTDDSAKNGENYNATNGTTTILAGSQSVTLSVDLINTNMSTSKTFSLSISEADVEISSDDITAIGTITGSEVVDGDDSDYEGPDICYDSRESSGFCMFGSCLFYKEKTNVRSMVNGLEDVSVKKSLTRGIAFLNIAPGVGINDEEKTLGSGDDEAEEKAFADSDFDDDGYYTASMFPKGYEYRIGTGANSSDGGNMNKDETSSYYDKALFKFGLFTQYTNIVTYEKNGHSYEEVLQACNPDTYGTLEQRPVITGCGLFMDGLNSNTKISFKTSAGIWQTVNYTSENNLNTPVIQNDNATALCSGVACTADGIGSPQMALPSFLSSQEVDNVSIPYSIVIADQHVGSLILNNSADTNLTATQRTIVFEAPYSSSYGSRVMLINSINDNLTNSGMLHHYVFKAGDYWIKNWDINTANDVTITTVGNVRFFIEGSFEILSNTLNIGHSGSQTSDKFYMYLYNDFSTTITGATAIQNGYIYSKGSLTLGSTTTIALDWGAITSDGELSIDNGAPSTFNYYAPTGDENSGFAILCDSGGAYSTGLFDAWDANIADDTLPVLDARILKTKVVNKPFEISLASLNVENNAYEVKAGTGNVDVAIYKKNTVTRIVSNPVSISYDPSIHEHLDSISITAMQATKDAVIGFKLCATYDEQTMTLSSTCTGDIKPCKYVSTSPVWRVCHSSDNFAIRPNSFSIQTVATPIKSDTNQSYTVNAKEYETDANVPLYTVSNADYLLDVNTTKYMPDNTENNSLHGSANVHAFSFVNGASPDSNPNVVMSFDDVAKVKLELQDRKWASVDINNPNDSTTLDCNGAYVCGSTISTFIPDHFLLDAAKLYNNTDTAKITYISNDLNMSAHIALRITAKNKSDITTKNFDKDSWNNNVSVNFSIATSGTPTLNKSEISNKKLNFEDGVYTIRSSDLNASTNLMFNYARSVNLAINPFVVNASDLNLGIVSSYGSIDITQKNAPSVTQSATFVYGRTHASRQRYDVVNDGDTKNANIYFDVFCSPSIGTACNLSLLNDIAPNKKRIDDTRWFINENHDTSKEGSIGIIVVKDGSNISSDIVDITDNPTGNPSVASMSYDATLGYSYKTTVQNNASSWLIYNQNNPSATKNSFSVEFEKGDGAWSGSHDTNTTTKDPATVKSNRRSMW